MSLDEHTNGIYFTSPSELAKHRKSPNDDDIASEDEPSEYKTYYIEGPPPLSREESDSGPCQITDFNGQNNGIYFTSSRELVEHFSNQNNDDRSSRNEHPEYKTCYLEGPSPVSREDSVKDEYLLSMSPKKENSNDSPSKTMEPRSKKEAVKDIYDEDNYTLARVSSSESNDNVNREDEETTNNDDNISLEKINSCSFSRIKIIITVVIFIFVLIIIGVLLAFLLLKTQDSCQYNENDKFDVTFHNSDVYPIDFNTFYPIEQVMRENILPEYEMTYTTSFTHMWTFVRSGTKERLTVNRNGLTSHVFEGCTFGAKPNQRIIVYIYGDSTSTSIEKTTMLTLTQTAVSPNQTTSRPHTLPTNSIKITNQESIMTSLAHSLMIQTTEQTVFPTNPIKITPIMTSSTQPIMIPTTDQTENSTLESTDEETTLLTSSALTKIVSSTDQTTTEHQRINDNILTFGGRNGRLYLNSAEVHHNLGDNNNNTTCQIQDLPKGMHGHSGVNTRLGVVSCGGFSKDCYMLNAGNEGWVPFKPLKDPRTYFTMHEFNDTLIVVGGIHTKTSLEHINLKTGREWIQEQLGFSIQEHCSVAVDEKTILLIGGLLKKKNSNRIIVSRNTTYLDIENWDLSPGPPMNGVRYDHGCAVSQYNGSPTVFVVGGRDEWGSYLDTVEMLNIQERKEWIVLNSRLPRPVVSLQVVTSHSSKYFIYTIGGHGNGDDRTEIYGLNQTFDWELVGNLAQKCYSHVSLNVEQNEIPDCK